MSYSVATIPTFDRQVKRLAKKFASLKTDLAELATRLAQDPTMGTPLGHHCYKVRMAIRSKGKGKSGGSRLITHVHVEGETIYLLTIYDKSEQTTLTESELDSLLLELLSE